MSTTKTKKYIVVAGQNKGTCDALLWASTSIRPYVLAQGECLSDVLERAERVAGHDDLHVHAFEV